MTEGSGPPVPDDVSGLGSGGADDGLVTYPDPNPVPPFDADGPMSYADPDVDPSVATDDRDEPMSYADPDVDPSVATDGPDGPMSYADPEVDPSVATDGPDGPMSYADPHLDPSIDAFDDADGPLADPADPGVAAGLSASERAQISAFADHAIDELDRADGPDIGSLLQAYLFASRVAGDPGPFLVQLSRPGSGDPEAPTPLESMLGHLGDLGGDTLVDRIDSGSDSEGFQGSPGSPDAGTPDAAENIDAGTPDAAENIDAGTPDAAENIDAGAPDAGPYDAGGFWSLPPGGPDPVWIPFAPEDFGNIGFLGFLSLIVDFVPIVGDVKGAIEFLTGKDAFTGEKLNWAERVLGLVSVIPGIDAVRHADEVIDLAKHGDEAAAVAKHGDDAAAVAKHGDEADDAAAKTADDVPGVAAKAMAAIPESADEIGATLLPLRDEAVRLTRLMSQAAEKAGDGAMTPQQFGSVADAIFKAYVKEAIDLGRLPARLMIGPPGLTQGALGKGIRAVDVWDPVTKEGWDLTTATVRQVAGHDARYIGPAMMDGTVLTQVNPLVYTRK